MSEPLSLEELVSASPRSLSSGVRVAQLIESRFPIGNLKIDLSQIDRNADDPVKKHLNWVLLNARVFHPLGISLDSHSINNIIHARPNDISQFLQMLNAKIDERKIKDSNGEKKPRKDAYSTRSAPSPSEPKALPRESLHTASPVEAFGMYAQKPPMSAPSKYRSYSNNYPHSGQNIRVNVASVNENHIRSVHSQNSNTDSTSTQNSSRSKLAFQALSVAISPTISQDRAYHLPRGSSKSNTHTNEREREEDEQTTTKDSSHIFSPVSEHMSSKSQPSQHAESQGVGMHWSENSAVEEQEKVEFEGTTLYGKDAKEFNEYKQSLDAKMEDALQQYDTSNGDYLMSVLDEYKSNKLKDINNLTSSATGGDGSGSDMDMEEKKQEELGKLDKELENLKKQLESQFMQSRNDLEKQLLVIYNRRLHEFIEKKVKENQQTNEGSEEKSMKDENMNKQVTAEEETDDTTVETEQESPRKRAQLNRQISHSVNIPRRLPLSSLQEDMDSSETDSDEQEMEEKLDIEVPQIVPENKTEEKQEETNESKETKGHSDMTRKVGEASHPTTLPTSQEQTQNVKVDQTPNPTARGPPPNPQGSIPNPPMMYTNYWGNPGYTGPQVIIAPPSVPPTYYVPYDMGMTGLLNQAIHAQQRMLAQDRSQNGVMSSNSLSNITQQRSAQATLSHSQSHPVIDIPSRTNSFGALRRLLSVSPTSNVTIPSETNKENTNSESSPQESLNKSGLIATLKQMSTTLETCVNEELNEDPSQAKEMDTLKALLDVYSNLQHLIDVKSKQITEHIHDRETGSATPVLGNAQSLPTPHSTQSSVRRKRVNTVAQSTKHSNSMRGLTDTSKPQARRSCSNLKRIKSRRNTHQNKESPVMPKDKIPKRKRKRKDMKPKSTAGCRSKSSRDHGAFSFVSRNSKRVVRKKTS